MKIYRRLEIIIDKKEKNGKEEYYINTKKVVDWMQSEQKRHTTSR